MKTISLLVFLAAGISIITGQFGWDSGLEPMKDRVCPKQNFICLNKTHYTFCGNTTDSYGHMKSVKGSRVFYCPLKYDCDETNEDSICTGDPSITTNVVSCVVDIYSQSQEKDDSSSSDSVEYSVNPPAAIEISGGTSGDSDDLTSMERPPVIPMFEKSAESYDIEPAIVSPPSSEEEHIIQPTYVSEEENDSDEDSEEEEFKYLQKGDETDGGFNIPPYVGEEEHIIQPSYVSEEENDSDEDSEEEEFEYLQKGDETDGGFNIPPYVGEEEHIIQPSYVSEEENDSDEDSEEEEFEYLQKGDETDGGFNIPVSSRESKTYNSKYSDEGIKYEPLESASFERNVYVPMLKPFAPSKYDKYSQEKLDYDKYLPPPVDWSNEEFPKKKKIKSRAKVYTEQNYICNIRTLGNVVCMEDNFFKHCEKTMTWATSTVRPCRDCKKGICKQCCRKSRG